MNEKMLTEIRKTSTRDFLARYELRKKLAQVDVDDVVVDMTPEDDAAARDACARLIRTVDGDVAVGQVRALSGVKEITYALVARKWDERSWLVIPFSSFSEPATDTELKLKVDGGLGLRVAQLWNARSLLTETIAKSWLVYTLPEEGVADIVSAWQWSVGVGELSEDQLARTGMPITKRKDPRIEYQETSLANFAKLDAKDLIATEHLAWLDSVRVELRVMKMASFTQSRVFERDYALAAAEVEKSVEADCRLPEFDGVVQVRYTPHDRRLYIRVFGADGNSSQKLDGWEVFGSDANSLGTISNAGFVCEFKSAFDGALCLAHEEGSEVHLLGSDNGVQDT